MHARWLLGLVLWGGLSAHAQTVHVRGTISGGDGKPVSGALVTLMKMGLKDTTGPDGAYSLVKGASGLMGLRAGSTSFSLIGGVLECRLPTPSAATLEVFDVEGHLLNADRRLAEKPGILHWDIAGEFPANQLLILRASAGGEVAVFRHMPLAGGFSGSAAVQPAGFGSRVLAKAAVAVDSLEVKAPGFGTKVVEVAAYDATVNVTLNAAAGRWGGLRNPPGKSAGCGKPAGLTGGKKTIRSSDKDRTYIIEIPPNYNPNTPHLLLYISHPGNGTSEQMQRIGYYRLKRLVDASGKPTLIVAPQSDVPGEPSTAGIRKSIRTRARA